MRDEGSWRWRERKGEWGKMLSLSKAFSDECYFQSHVSNTAQQWDTETYLAHYLSATNDILQQCITHLSLSDRLSVSLGTS